MEKTQILLITDDKVYGQRLIDCVRKMKSRLKIQGVSVKDFIDASNLNINMPGLSRKEIRKFRIFLIDHEDEKSFENLKEKIKILLSDEEEYVVLRLVDETLIQEQRDIFKYSKVSDLINKIIQKYSFATGNYIPRYIVKDDNCKVISVMSNGGGSGASSLSLLLGRELAMEKDEKTLFISLGSTHEERYFFPWNRSGSLREYLYHMFHGDARYCFALDTYLKRDEYGLFYFNVNTYTNKIYELSHENFENFINHLLKMQLFNNIIFDIGFDLSEKSKLIADLSHKIIFLTRENCPKCDDFYNYMEIDEGKVILAENFTKVNKVMDLFFSDNQEESEFNNSTERGSCIKLPQDNNAFIYVEDRIEINRDSEFGREVSRLVDLIF